MDELSSIKIPIPTLERQQQIVDDCMLIEENKIQAEKMIVRLEGMAQSYHTNHIHRMLYDGSAEVKTLGEVCTFISGKYNSFDCENMGAFPFYTGKACNPSGFSNNYCFDYDDYLIIIKDGGAGVNKYGNHIGLGKVFRVSGKSSATTHQIALVPNAYISNFKYVYTYLKLKKNDIMDMASYTTGLGCIRKSNLMEFKITFPTLQRQHEIVADMDDLYSQIEAAKNIVASYDKWIKLAIAL
jgi:restriction endonuclease S subunit